MLASEGPTPAHDLITPRIADPRRAHLEDPDESTRADPTQHKPLGSEAQASRTEYFETASRIDAASRITTGLQGHPAPTWTDSSTTHRKPHDGGRSLHTSTYIRGRSAMRTVAKAAMNCPTDLTTSSTRAEPRELDEGS